MIRFLMRGALAGAVATVPMTAVFMAAEKTGLMGEIPPKHITRDLLRYAGARPMRRETWNAACPGQPCTRSTNAWRLPMCTH